MDALFALVWGVLVATLLTWRFEALLSRSDTARRAPEER